MCGPSRGRARHAARDAAADGVVDLGAAAVARAVFESHDADLALDRCCIVIKWRKTSLRTPGIRAPCGMEVTADALMLSFSSDSDRTLKIDAQWSDTYALGQSTSSEAKLADYSNRYFSPGALGDICRAELFGYHGEELVTATRNAGSVFVTSEFWNTPELRMGPGDAFIFHVHNMLRAPAVYAVFLCTARTRGVISFALSDLLCFEPLCLVWRFQ